MRALLSSTANAGHFRPMLPFARALMDAGWEVAAATPASYAGEVRAAGLYALPFADVDPALMGAVFSRLPSLPPGQADLVVVRELFAGLDAQAALPGLTATIADWQPDIVLHEQAEFGSAAAALAAGVPQVQVAIGMAQLTGNFLGIVRSPLSELASRAGVDGGELQAVIAGSPTLTAVPPSLAAPEFFPDPPTDPLDLAVGEAWRFAPEVRPASTEAAQDRLPAPWGDPDEPLVYATFGSIAAQLPPTRHSYRDLVVALADLPVRVLLTTGAPLDQVHLGVLPGNVHAEPWWAQELIMPQAAAMIAHGGFGTTMAAVEAGVPQVVVPLFTVDQEVNGRQIEASGAGLHVTGGPPAAGSVGGPLQQILADPAYAEQARQLALEMRTLSPLADLPGRLTGYLRQ